MGFAILDFERPLLEVQGPPSAGVNFELLSMMLRRQVVISRLQEQTARRMASLYLQAAREARNRIFAAFSGGLPGDAFSQALRARVAGDLLREIRPVVEVLGGQIQAEFDATLNALWQAETATGAQVFGQAIPRDLLLNLSVLRPAPTLLDVANLEVLGQSLGRWGRRATEQALNELGRELSIGSLQGDDMRAMIARVARVFDVSARAARDTARTAVQTVSLQANARIWDANRSFLHGVQYSATFDDRTCPVCSGLDGRTYKFHGTPSFERRPQIPVHMNCRCVYVPITRSWRTMGIARDSISKGTRASMNGQVPGKITFANWLRTQPPEVADDILGKGRAALWRSGKVTLRDFLNERTYREVPLQKIRRLLASA